MNKTYTGSLKGQRCACIAGGPSLTGKAERLRIKLQMSNIFTIGVNRAALLLQTDFAAIYDYENFEKNHDLDKYKGIIFAPAHNDKIRHNHFPIELLPGSYGMTDSFEDGLYANGGSSGLAVSIAYAMGANPIYLYGYDFCLPANGEPDHWYKEGTIKAETLKTQRIVLRRAINLTSKLITCMNPESKLHGRN